MVAKIEKFLALARKIISGKITLPILEHICFTNGKMMATDLDNTLVMDVDIKASFTISHKLLTKIMKQKPQSLAVIVNDSTVTVTYDGKKLTFSSIPVDEYPDIPLKVEKEIDTWDRNLVKLFHSQRPYVSTEELKPALTGVYIQSNGSLESCATDGHMMRVLRMGSGRDTGYKMILRPKTLDLIFSGSRKDVRIFESDSHYRFPLSHDLDLVVRKIDERYPDYQHVIPEECAERVSFRHMDFMKLIKSSKPFVSRESKLIEIAVKGENLTARATDIDQGIDWSGQIPIESIADECHFGFDIGYLERIISGINTEKLTWQHNGSADASIFSGDVKDNIEQINLLMPVRQEGAEN